MEEINMKKILSLLSLTTILGTSSLLPLTQINGTQILNNQEMLFQEVGVIDEINQGLSVTAQPGFDVVLDDYEYEAILNISWEDAQQVTSAVATDSFIHSLARGKKVSNELNLTLSDIQRPESVTLSGILTDFDYENQQLSDIFIFIRIHKVPKNLNVIKVWVKVQVHAKNAHESETCGTSCFIDKIVLKK